MSDILVIGDAHSKPGESNDRFSWLGKFISDIKPDYVVDMGDWASMDSLSGFDKGKASFQGKTYKGDVDHANDAYERVRHEVRKSKKRQPKFFSLIGNHEERIARALDTDAAKLTGVISVKDIQSWERRGNDGLINYDPLVIEDIHFNHSFPRGVMGKPMSGDEQATALLKNMYKSAVVGHSHLLDYSVRTSADGKKIMGLVAGCYLSPTQYEVYAGKLVNDMWWRGLCLLKGVDKGQYDLHLYNINTIKEEYK